MHRSWCERECGRRSGVGSRCIDNPANEESYADLAHANLAGSANASGVYNQNLNSLYTNSDSNVTAPPSLVAENLGSQSNLVTAADEGTQNPLILVNLGSTGGVAPTATAISTSQYVVNPTASTTPVTINTTSGYWWGAGEEGTQGSNALRQFLTQPCWLTVRRSAPLEPVGQAR